MEQRVDRPWASLIVWLLVPATEIWLHLAAAAPSVPLALAVEALAFAWVGLVLPRLRSWPILGHPVWVLFLLGLLAGLYEAPSDGRVVPYVAGLLGLLGLPAVVVARRVRLPWWAVALCIPPLVVTVHLKRALSTDFVDAPALSDRLRDLKGPLLEPALPSSRDVGPPVIVVSVDTLRADSARGMQTFERLAEGGAWWPSAMSTSSWTLPALASLQTGLAPGEHGAGALPGDHYQGLDPEVTTLAEALAGAGYATVGISTNPWAGRNNGLDRGFHRFHDLGLDPWRPLLFTGSALLGAHPQDASVAVDLAIDALDDLQGSDSFYLWLHLIDPHLPYTHADDPSLQTLTVQDLRNAGLLASERRERIRAAYDAEVAYTDAHLGRFLDALEARGLLDEALVVFTSDHGEEFWEHGGVEHGHSHHAEVVEVPLVVRGPGIAPGRRRGTASLADVAGTLLAAVGAGSAEVDLRGAIPERRIATAQGNLHFELACSARDEGTRVIAQGCGEGPTRAFDLATDPGELKPLEPVSDDPVHRAARAVRVPDARDVSRQATEALKALGYLD